MYELWLGLNILWELAREYALPLAAGSIVWLLLVGLALSRRGARWRATLPAALAAGAAIAAIAMLAAPALTRSSLADMGYWVDWATLAAIGLGVGGIAVAFAWPFLAMRRG